MKRHRFLNFYIDSSRNLFKGEKSTLLFEEYKEEQRVSMGKKYGSGNFNEKFKRWISIPKPVLSVVGEHSYLLQDIEDAYILGSFYSALTGACCLGERIFNQIILNTKEFYRSTMEYKTIYRKDSINDWNLGINTLVAWGIIKTETEIKFRQLGELRNASVHFQKKEQDLEKLAVESIRLVNLIVSDLFELKKEKDFLIWFEVPGELYLKKEAEEKPFIKAFFIPCAPLVDFNHTIESTTNLSYRIVGGGSYETREITDEEFVRLRNEHNKTK